MTRATPRKPEAKKPERPAAKSSPDGRPWGVNSEYGTLHDVLLCSPENFRWLPTSSISKATLASGAKFDRQLAMKQHREMVQAYEDAGVTVHYLDPESRPMRMQGSRCITSIPTKRCPIRSMPGIRAS
jgi:hypothetical protein